jgi:hypothetical protein
MEFAPLERLGRSVSGVVYVELRVVSYATFEHLELWR